MKKILKKNIKTKNLFIISIMVIVFTTIISCTRDNDELVEITKEETKIEFTKKEISLRKFEKSLIDAQEKIRKSRNLEWKTNLSKEYMSISEAQTLLNEVSSAGISFMNDYGFTIEDYYEMFGTYNTFEIQEEISAAGVLLYALETNQILESYISDSNLLGGLKSNSKFFKGGGNVRKCFLEATGIAAGVALIGALSGQAGGIALRKAFTKAVKKIGGRLVGGIGLILMAADFTICMTVDLEKSTETSILPEDILEVRSLKTGDIVYISKKGLRVSDNFGESIDENTKYQTYEINYGYTTIAIQDVTEDTPIIIKRNFGFDALIQGKDIDLNSIKQYERLVFDDIYKEISPLIPSI